MDEQNIVYPSGANTILYNLESKTQKFIHLSEKGTGITAIAVSPNKKFLAIAERGDRPQCVIYDIQSQRKRKTLTIETESRVRESDLGVCFYCIFARFENACDAISSA